MAVLNRACDQYYACFTGQDPGFEISCKSNPFGKQFTFDSELGKQYYVHVYGQATQNVGAFAISAYDYARPANDDCVQALPIQVNAADATPGNTLNATIDNYCNNRNHRGTWHLFVGTGNVMTVSACHNVFTKFDVKIDVSSKSCSNYYGCLANEDPGIDIAVCGSTFGQQVTFDSIANEKYYVIAHGSTTSNVGEYGLSVVDYQRPSHDDCTTARSIVVNGPVERGSTVNATRETYCNNRKARGVWHVVVGTGNIMTVSACSDLTDYDVRLDVVSSSCSNYYGCVAPEDPGFDIPVCRSPFGRKLTFDSVADRLYYIIVYGQTESTVGGYGISVVDYTRPSNDKCLEATEITVDSEPMTVSTVNATRTTSCGKEGRGTWYRVFGTGNPLVISTCGYATNFDHRITVTENSCSNARCIDLTTHSLCQYNTLGQIVTFPSVAGRQYYIHLYGAETSLAGTAHIHVFDNTTTVLTLPPTGAPSETAAPTITVPTCMPIEAPAVLTNAPRTVSSTAPTHLPTSTPTNLPTKTPTNLPTAFPSSRPTLRPTVAPTTSRLTEPPSDTSAPPESTCTCPPVLEQQTSERTSSGSLSKWNSLLAVVFSLTIFIFSCLVS